MASKALPSPEVLRQLLRYEPETGKLYWKPRSLRWFSGEVIPASAYRESWNVRFANKEAFRAAGPDGYRRGCVLGKNLLAHRVIMAMNFGVWPEHDVDHIDGNRANNRLDNLRTATRAENRQNVGLSKNNTSGFTGVSYSKKFGKWVAQIMVGRRSHFLGHFSSPDGAAAAYAAAKTEKHRFCPVLRD